MWPRLRSRWADKAGSCGAPHTPVCSERALALDQDAMTTAIARCQLYTDDAGVQKCQSGLVDRMLELGEGLFGIGGKP